MCSQSKDRGRPSPRDTARLPSFGVLLGKSKSGVLGIIPRPQYLEPEKNTPRRNSTLLKRLRILRSEKQLLDKAISAMEKVQETRKNRGDLQTLLRVA